MEVGQNPASPQQNTNTTLADLPHASVSRHSKDGSPLLTPAHASPPSRHRRSSRSIGGADLSPRDGDAREGQAAGAGVGSPDAAASRRGRTTDGAGSLGGSLGEGGREVATQKDGGSASGGGARQGVQGVTATGRSPLSKWGMEKARLLGAAAGGGGSPLSSWGRSRVVPVNLQPDNPSAPSRAAGGSELQAISFVSSPPTPFFSFIGSNCADCSGLSAPFSSLFSSLPLLQERFYCKCRQIIDTLQPP
jgi:hypothetical protein